MDLQKQLETLNAQGDYQAIIDTLKALPKEELTPALVSELARAYNNLAGPDTPEYYRKAIELLKSVESSLTDDHTFNFRMGYAYYYLGEEGYALPYFEKALSARPGDRDTRMFIEGCRQQLSLPQFQKSFARRVKEAWDSFVEKEAGLRELLGGGENGAAASARCKELFAQVLGDGAAVDLSLSGGVYRLTLIPGEEKTQALSLCYFVKHAPDEVLHHWEVRVDCQGSPEALKEIGLCPTDGAPFPAEEITPYNREPEKAEAFPGEKIPLRRDILSGVTVCPLFEKEYLAGKTGGIDALHRDGAVPGFFYYSLTEDSPKGNSSGKEGLALRDSLQDKILQKAGDKAVTFLGGASGTAHEYLDFIAWDLPALLDAAVEVFKQSPVLKASFHTFRQDAGGVLLKEAEDVKEQEAAQEAPASVPPAEQNPSEETSGEAANESEAKEEASKETGAFVGFVLLSRTFWDKAQLIRDLKEDWGVDATENEVDGSAPTDRDTGTLIFTEGNMMATVSLMPVPVPDHEAEENAVHNYLWPQAVETAKDHKAHLIVGVMGENASLLDRGKLFVKVLAACCKQPAATGIYTSGTVFEPGFYKDFAAMMKEGSLPIFNWIWFGLYRDENGISGYTYGMEVFGKEEMEVLNADAKPGDVQNFLANMAAYVLDGDITLHDGETIGFSEEQRLPITRSQGVALPGMTLKIGYGKPE